MLYMEIKNNTTLNMNICYEEKKTDMINRNRMPKSISAPRNSMSRTLYKEASSQNTFSLNTSYAGEHNVIQGK